MVQSPSKVEAAPGCLAVVTSRNRLTGLVAREGAHPLLLSLLSADEAQHLLAQRIPPERIAATGGSPVIGYRVTASTGTATTVTGRMVLLGKEAFAVFAGLHNGTAYTFTVAAVTAAGTGPAATSPPVTPGPV